MSDLTKLAEAYGRGEVPEGAIYGQCIGDRVYWYDDPECVKIGSLEAKCKALKAERDDCRLRYLKMWAERDALLAQNEELREELQKAANYIVECDDDPAIRAGVADAIEMTLHQPASLAELKARVVEEMLAISCAAVTDYGLAYLKEDVEPYANQLRESKE